MHLQDTLPADRQCFLNHSDDFCTPRRSHAVVMKCVASIVRACYSTRLAD